MTPTWMDFMADGATRTQSYGSHGWSTVERGGLVTRRLLEAVAGAWYASRSVGCGASIHDVQVSSAREVLRGGCTSRAAAGKT